MEEVKGKELLLFFLFPFTHFPFLKTQRAILDA